MNEEATKLINQLATKLGTTTDYLWSILLKQAPIAATVDLIQTICIVVFGVILFILHRRFTTIKEGERDSAYEKNEALIMIMLFSSAMFAILFIFAFFCIGDIVNGYFNPEYWALNKILSQLKD